MTTQDQDGVSKCHRWWIPVGVTLGLAPVAFLGYHAIQKWLEGVKQKQEVKKRMDEKKYGFSAGDIGKENLYNTVKYYEKHVFIGMGAESVEQWPPRPFDIKSANALGSCVKRVFESIDSNGEPVKYKLNACDAPLGRVLIFPDFVEYDIQVPTEAVGQCSIDENMLASILRLHLLGEPEEALDPIPMKKDIHSTTHIFVCCHGSRDMRCGVRGPIIVDAFRRELPAYEKANETTNVFACSHVGGHKYAGNVIVMKKRPGAKPGEHVVGDWYGYVTPNDIPTILDAHLVNDTFVPRNWRGSMSPCAFCDCGTLP